MSGDQAIPTEQGARRGWDLHIIKGKPLIVDARDEELDMNRRPGGDASLNVPIRNDGEAGEWQDWLAEDTASQETTLAEGEESTNRHKALVGALTVLNERGATSLRLGGWLMIPHAGRTCPGARQLNYINCVPR